MRRPTTRELEIIKRANPTVEGPQPPLVRVKARVVTEPKPIEVKVVPNRGVEYSPIRKFALALCIAGTLFALLTGQVAYASVAAVMGLFMAFWNGKIH